MDVTQLPFNRFLGLEACPADSGALVGLPGEARYTNHLGTVHASALLAVAEATSGVFLVQQLGSGAGYLPVVRRLEARFRKPAMGRVCGRASAAPEEVARWSAELTSRGRVLASVPVEVFDADEVVILSATIEWFIARQAVAEQT